MKIAIYIDSFQSIPSIWKCRFSGERARYFGHTWALSVNWLWFELMIYGTPSDVKYKGG